MAIRTSYAHGTFSWVELATTDAAAAKRFYSALFGWTFDDNPAGPGMIYTMCKLGERHVAALYGLDDSRKGVPPHWDSYITVESVDAASKSAAANGGKILKAPFDVLDVGRMAVIQDPSGATFCLWSAKSHIGAGLKDDPGSLTWSELITDDTALAEKFYSKTLGWVTEAFDMGPMGTYTLFKRPGETDNVAGMIALGPQMNGVPPHWLNYFAVTNVDASAERVGALGGRVATPPMDIPDIGRFAIVQDPQGATFALYMGAH